MPLGGLIFINMLAHAEVTLLMDRGIKKIRVNLFKNGKLIGFLKPLSSFSNGGRETGNREDSNLI